MTINDKFTQVINPEERGCFNCEHHYMNHKACDLPSGIKCNGGSNWKKRKDILESFKDKGGKP